MALDLRFKRNYRLALPAFSVGANLTALLQYHFNTEVITVAPQFTLQFHIFLLTSSALSVLLYFLRGSWGRAAILWLKGLILWLAGYPLGSYLGVEFTLLTALVLETTLCQPFPWGLGFALLFSAVSIFSQRPADAWTYSLQAPPRAAVLVYGIYSCFLILLGHLLRHLHEKTRRQEDAINWLDFTVNRLSQANREFQEHAIAIKERTEIEERKRISRDIHDTVGYTLTNLMVMMESATDFSKTQPDKAEQLLELAREEARKALDETRRSLRELHSIGGEHVIGLKAIDRLVKTFEQATGVRVTTEYGNFPWSLDKETDLAVYHLVQEGMINAFRHGKATEVKVKFCVHDSEAKVYVSDNGTGASTIKEGLGFAGMKERVRQLGGGFSARNIGGGFEVSVSFPVVSAQC